VDWASDVLAQERLMLITSGVWVIAGIAVSTRLPGTLKTATPDVLQLDPGIDTTGIGRRCRSVGIHTEVGRDVCLGENTRRWR